MENTLTESLDPVWARHEPGTWPRLREELIEQYRPLALAAARRFRPRRDEDLEQVAMVALVQAVDRYDPGRGTRFSTFATSTILGEIKHYFRDHCHSMRFPRRLQELRNSIVTVNGELTQEIGRPPTLPEIAEALNVELDQVVEAMAMEPLDYLYSLSASVSAAMEGESTALEELVGARDRELEQVEARVAWGQILDYLGPDLKVVIELRFFHDLTQAETGEQLGVSQMQVSRMERRALERLRALMPALSRG